MSLVLFNMARGITKDKMDIQWTILSWQHICSYMEKSYKDIVAKNGETIRGNLRQTSRPVASRRSGLLSPFGPPSNLKLNLFTRLANVSSTKGNAKPSPGQRLLPDPNGKYLKFCPSKSKGESKCLSGLNFSASGPQVAVSRWIAYKLIKTCTCFAKYIFLEKKA